MKVKLSRKDLDFIQWVLLRSKYQFEYPGAMKDPRVLVSTEEIQRLNEIVLKLDKLFNKQREKKK